MPTGELVNENLQRQLQAVLDEMGKEEAEQLATRVKAEEKICLDSQQRARYVREVRAWEGSKIFIRAPNTKERAVQCCRVGNAYLLIQEEGREPIKVKRAALQIRTPEERLLAILGDKIDTARAKGHQQLQATSTRLERFQANHVKDCAEFEKVMANLTAFQARVYSVLVRKGLIIGTPGKDSG